MFASSSFLLFYDSLYFVSQKPSSRTSPFLFFGFIISFVCIIYLASSFYSQLSFLMRKVSCLVLFTCKHFAFILLLCFIFGIDAPKCESPSSQLVGVALHESAQVECIVAANPVAEVRFDWKLNNTNKSKMSIISNIHKQQSKQNQLKSIAKLVPDSETDFGSLYCWASNSIGQQQEPCVFQLIKAGKFNNTKLVHYRYYRCDC